MAYFSQPEGDMTLTYDAAVRIDTKLMFLMHDQSDSHHYYGYDTLDRLAVEDRRSNASGRKIDWYGFDAVQNRTAKETFDVYDTATTESAYADAHDAGDRLVSRTATGVGAAASAFGYDARGNMASACVDGASTDTFVHDRWGRLTGVARAGGNATAYTYDTSGRPLARLASDGTVERSYFQGLTRLVTRAKSAGSGAPWRTTRVWYERPGQAGHVLGQRDNTAWDGSGAATAATDTYLHYDHIGSVVMRTDQYGSPADDRVADAFGKPLSDGYFPAEGLGQTTKWRDADTGLDWFGARWYDARLGRWLEPEPTGADGPNLYHNVFNSPSLGRDINGRMTLWYDFFEAIGPFGMARNWRWFYDCANRIAAEADIVYDGRAPHDKFKHCLVACRVKSECRGCILAPNPAFIRLGGLKHELDGWAGDSFGDLWANEQGINASDCAEGCEATCGKLYKPMHNR